ncbi:MAG: hypothetical protein OEN01_01055 [Candidatus Krumholzibacteria bacterium]|nr:hypothetical protein [Candidatus Krumholzibacteria bacterium]
MTRYRIVKTISDVTLVLSFLIPLGSCGGDGGSQGTTAVNGGDAGGDFVKLSLDGGTESTHNEASGLPNIDCDPRVDWAFSQVVLWDNHTGGSGPNGYELFLEIMFPAVDTVGTYTVHGDSFQALFYNGVNYAASPLFSTSAGTVNVTRSDARIEGTYNITVVDMGETASINLTGSFGIDAGFSLSCP